MSSLFYLFLCVSETWMKSLHWRCYWLPNRQYSVACLAHLPGMDPHNNLNLKTTKIGLSDNHNNASICINIIVMHPFIPPICRAPPWSNGSVLDQRSPSPVFESRRGHIWRVFHLWLRFISFGDRSAHLSYDVHKSGHKTSIIIIIIIIVIIHAFINISNPA